MKNVVISFLSRYTEDRAVEEWTDESGEYRGKSGQTNEHCLEYLMWKLAKDKQKIDKVFLFVKSGEDEYYDGFRSMYLAGLKKRYEAKTGNDIESEKIMIEYTMHAANGKVPEMYEKLCKYRKKTGEDVCVNVDITGGPRFGPMMFLPLLQLLKYSGFIIGEVLYANKGKSGSNIIEDATELLGVTSLIGGAEEFISYGKIRQINAYFGGNDLGKIEVRVQTLLKKMAEFSECLSVCGSYEVTEQALSDLSFAIKKYEESYNRDKNVGVQEQYFSTLLPQIKKEYQDLLDNDDSRKPEKIIRWCINKDLLQQAVTFFTEWIPRALIASKLLCIKDEAIIEECEKNGGLWSHWSIYFFRNYLPAGNIVPGDDNSASRRDFNRMAQTGDFDKVFKYVEGKCPKLEDFLNEVKNFSRDCGISGITKNFPSDSMIYKVMEITTPTNTTTKKYIEQRLAKTGGNIKEVIIKALATVPEKEFEELFCGDGSKSFVKKDDDENKPRKRRETFKYLLENNLISTKLKGDSLLCFVEEYERIVENIRHKLAHANSGGRENNGEIDIGSTIKRALDLLEKK